MKERDVAQGLDEPWVEEPLTIDCQEATLTSVTTDQDGNDEDEEAEGFENDEETQNTRGVIRGLEALWGKTPLPADLREVIATALPSESAR